MTESVVRLVVGLSLSVLIARHLGPESFGILSYALACTAILGVLASAGLNRAVVRDLVRCNLQTTERTRLVSTAVAVKCMVALVAYGSGLGLAIATDQSSLAVLAVTGASLLFGPADVIDLAFQARTESKRAVLAKLIALAISTAVRIGLLTSGASVLAFAAANLIEAAMTAIALLVAWQRNGFLLRRSQIDLTLGRRLVLENLPEVLAGFGAILFMRLDQVMLQNLASSAEVGVYSVAARVSESWYFVPSAIIASTFPSIVRAREEDPVLYLRRLRQLMSGLVFLSYVAILVTMLVADPLMPMLFGEAYQASATVLIIHIWCGLFVSLGLASGSWIMAERRPTLNLYRNLAGLAVNVFLNFLLIPSYGATGAAAATLASLIVAFYLFDMVYPALRPMVRMKHRAMMLADCADLVRQLRVSTRGAPL